jgi:uncharacterized membrane protein
VVKRRHPRWVHSVFADADLDAIAAAVAAAERDTSAEIRVHLERRVGRTGDALARAREVFAALGMHRTAERNGVLVYLALEDRTLALVGDDGVHALVGDEYWANLRDRMVARLRERASRDAVIDVVGALGEALARHFPRRRDDRNELSDTVSLE